MSTADEWIKHEGTEPPALAPAALVEIERYGRWPQVPKQTRRAAEIPWHTGLLYRQLRDEDGTPYIAADGLEGWAEYVATDSDGLVGQFKARPWIECVLWVTGLVACEYSAPETHRHPGDWRESLYRVWRP